MIGTSGVAVRCKDSKYVSSYVLAAAVESLLLKSLLVSGCILCCY